MLAQRKEDYDYYDYDEPLYEEPQEIVQPEPQVVHRQGRKKQLDTRLRSRCQMLFITVAILAMIVTIRSGISASRGYELVAVQQQIQDVERENERLRIEIAQLKSPQRIGQIAVGQLGMEVPNKMYFSHDR